MQFFVVTRYLIVCDLTVSERIDLANILKKYFVTFLKCIHLHLENKTYVEDIAI